MHHTLPLNTIVFASTFFPCLPSVVLFQLQVAEAVGEPIMGHGETTSRGRRRHVRYGTKMIWMMDTINLK